MSVYWNKWLAKWRVQRVVAVAPFFTCLLSAGISQAQEPLSVSNPRASQRAGTRLVDIYYGFQGGTPPYTVSVEGSGDGGTTWELPLSTLSGDLGNGVTPGTNRKITWNAGLDWAEQLSDSVVFRVNVSGAAPVLDGFIPIPAGSFSMGDANGVGGSEELPVHTVELSSFLIGKYEVTQSLYDEVRDWGLVNGYPSIQTPFRGPAKGADHPVSDISWFDVVLWCNARSEKEGLDPCYKVGGAVYRVGENNSVVCDFSANGYRLPTEAEWEKAARGGLVGKIFPWGDVISHNEANYYSRFFAYENPQNAFYHPDYSNGTYDGSENFTAPVGSFAPNGFGLYDMAGNIQEWCWDWEGAYPSGPVTNPGGAPTGGKRLTRGGSWFSFGGYSVRNARRDPKDQEFSYFDIGFRLARSVVP